jgi:hypothetical protein
MSLALIGVYDLMIGEASLLEATVHVSKSSAFPMVYRELRVELSTKILHAYGEMPELALTGHRLQLEDVMRLIENGPDNCDWLGDVIQKLHDCHTAFMC